MEKKHFVVAYGGESTEHDISIITAIGVYLEAKKEFCDAEINLVYTRKDGRMFMGEGLEKFSSYKNFDENKFKEVAFLTGDDNLYLKKKNKFKKLFKIDFLINAFHGGCGEDGKFSAMLENSRIVNSASDYKALAVCMDKFLTKSLALTVGVRTIDFFVITREEWEDSKKKVLQTMEQFDFPVVVKPVAQGSSIGVSFASTYDEFTKAINLAFKFDYKVIVERAILKKREFNVVCVKKENGEIITRIEEPECSSVIISFNDKYLNGTSGGKLNKYKGAISVSSLGMANQERKTSVDIKPKDKAYLIKHTKLLYDAINLNGIVRFDYIMDTENNKFYLGEINAVPGSLGLYFFNLEKEQILKEVYNNSQKHWKRIWDSVSLNSAPCIFK